MERNCREFYGRAGFSAALFYAKILNFKKFEGGYEKEAGFLRPARQEHNFCREIYCNGQFTIRT